MGVNFHKFATDGTDHGERRSHEDKSANFVIVARSCSDSLITGGAALRGPQAAGLKDDDLIPRWPSTALINVVVVVGQTNPYYQVANMSYSKSVSIDKWM
ncbi:MAG TPA: hypothetical protein VN777_10260 [Terriglobales bacterium]|jgi:hypothetical protein|nr:hypothetical protein [Terriglobales bacterium]